MKTGMVLCEICRVPARSGALLCRSCGSELPSLRPSGMLAAISASASIAGSSGILLAAVAPQGIGAVFAVTGAVLLCAGLVSAAISIRSALTGPAPCARTTFSLSALDAIRGGGIGMRMSGTLMGVNPFGVKAG